MSSDPWLMTPLEARSGDMSVKDVTEVREECGLLSAPRTQRPVCVHTGTPIPAGSAALVSSFAITIQLQTHRLPLCPAAGALSNGIGAHWVPAEHGQQCQPPSRPTWLPENLGFQ